MGARWLSRYSVGLALRRSQVQTLATSYRRISVGKNIKTMDVNHGVPRVHWDRRARKICGVQRPGGACVRCRRKYHWVPAQVSTSSLDRGSLITRRNWLCKAPHGG